MTLAAVNALGPKEVAQFQRDGFFIVSGLYAPETVLEWKRIMTDLIAQEPHNQSGVRVWGADHMHPVLRAAMGDDRVVPMLNRLISPDIEFLSAKAVFKNSATKFGSPWHQDCFYWDGNAKYSVWIALDDATVENGCLRFIPGSHVKVFPRVVINEAIGFGNRIDEKDIAGWPILDLAVKRGDAVVFHDRAVHSSHPNATGADRWSLISTYRVASEKDACGLNENLWKFPFLVSGRSVNGGAR